MSFVVWIVGSWIFFKVAIGIFLPEDISVVGSLIMSCILGINIFLSAGHYASLLGKTLAQVRFGAGDGKYLEYSFNIFFISAAIHGVLCYLIIMGFSNQFYDRISYNKIRILIFELIALLPLLTNYFLVLIGFHYSIANARSQDP